MRVLRHLLKKAKHFHSPPREIFLKQYGERRTGTNFIRAALLANYANAVPLMHVLGDKHSPPVDLNAHLESALHLPNPEWEFASRATFAAPAESTSEQDAMQLEHLKTIAPSLTAAVREGRIGFLISLKHPRPWVVSIANYWGWVKNVNGCWRMSPELAPQLESVCKTYNMRHEAWLALYRKNEARSVLIHHEKLLDAPEQVMAEIEEKFDLRRRHWRLKFFEKKAESAHWDHHSPEFIHAFDPDYYRQKRYEDVLGPGLWAVVDCTIDWNLMAGVGYGKLPGA